MSTSVTIINSAGSVRHSAEFSGTGVPVISTFVGQVWFNKTGEQLIVSDITLWQQTAGISGNTVIDILINSGTNWTSVWSINQSNRLSISQALGNDVAVSSTIFDNSLVPANSKIRMDIIQVQNGLPENIFVQVSF